MHRVLQKDSQQWCLSKPGGRGALSWHFNHQRKWATVLQPSESPSASGPMTRSPFLRVHKVTTGFTNYIRKSFKKQNKEPSPSQNSHNYLSFSSFSPSIKCERRKLMWLSAFGDRKTYKDRRVYRKRCLNVDDSSKLRKCRRFYELSNILLFNIFKSQHWVTHLETKGYGLKITFNENSVAPFIPHFTKSLTSV